MRNCKLFPISSKTTTISRPSRFPDTLVAAHTHTSYTTGETTAAEVISSAHCMCCTSRASSILAHIYFMCGKCASGRAVAKEHCMHIYTPKWNVRFILSPTNFGRWLWGIPSWTRYKAQATLCVRSTMFIHPSQLHIRHLYHTYVHDAIRVLLAHTAFSISLKMDILSKCWCAVLVVQCCQDNSINFSYIHTMIIKEQP